MSKVLAGLIAIIGLAFPLPVEAQVSNLPTGTIPPMHGPLPTGTIPPPAPRIGLPVPTIGLKPPPAPIRPAVDPNHRSSTFNRRDFGHRTVTSVPFFAWPSVVYVVPQTVIEAGTTPTTSVSPVSQSE